MKQMKYEGLFLCLLFILFTYLFSRSYYMVFFLSLFILLLLLGFFKEKNRLFSWLIISFFSGHLILFYFDIFLDGAHLTPYKQLIVSQLLLIIPIITSYYVIMKFKIKISHYITVPSLSLFRAVPIKVFLLTLSIIGLGSLLVYFNRHGGTKTFFSLLLFSSTRAIFEEIIWRGILLTHIIKITNARIGILVTSIGFGINTTMYGFSLHLTFVYILMGLLFGLLTVKSNSILPAIFVHAFVIILLFIGGYLSIPI
ncbi:type II CAAX endopeptidase family protein [Neobacillus sp. FSL H8-0543]|uniref:CPBP family intramembrane glutamic endopeptidase n=1 Tax=Neobacillus sp. FSL H8-0543 TaxID=2954672 RepID=UPI00315867A4